MIRLEAASMVPPKGLEAFLADLGEGENGFGGTPVFTAQATLQEYLCGCCEMQDPSRVKPGLVPQTVFWALNEDGEVVGMVRLRHHLNDRLLIHGGHCGYYVRSDQRRKGYGTEMLKLALCELRRLGVTRALITVDRTNAASIEVVEANGGRFADVSNDPETGVNCNRYWINL